MPTPPTISIERTRDEAGPTDGPYRELGGVSRDRLVLRWRATRPERRADANAMVGGGSAVIVLAVLGAALHWSALAVCVPGCWLVLRGHHARYRQIRVELDIDDLEVDDGGARRRIALADIVRTSLSPG